MVRGQAAAGRFGMTLVECHPKTRHSNQRRDDALF